MSSKKPNPIITQTKSKAYSELKGLVDAYSQVLPRSTYPWVILTIAAGCVFFSWFGGNYLFHDTPLVHRMFYAWLFTAVEYAFLLPGIGGAVEVLGYSQNSLAVMIHALQLSMYMILNRLTTQYPFTWRHALAFPLMFVAVLLVAYDDKKVY